MASGSEPKREPRGIPSGGQYAAEYRPENASVSLDPPKPADKEAFWYQANETKRGISSQHYDTDLYASMRVWVDQGGARVTGMARLGMSTPDLETKVTPQVLKAHLERHGIDLEVTTHGAYRTPNGFIEIKQRFGFDDTPASAGEAMNHDERLMALRESIPELEQQLTDMGATGTVDLESAAMHDYFESAAVTYKSTGLRTADFPYPCTSMNVGNRVIDTARHQIMENSDGTLGIYTRKINTESPWFDAPPPF